MPNAPRPDRYRTIEVAVLDMNLTLEAIGLLMHMGDDIVLANLQEQFPSYDVEKLVSELWDKGLLMDDAEEIEEIEEKPQAEISMPISVYCIKSRDTYKIGITINVQNRLKTIRTYTPFGATLIWHRVFPEAGRVEAYMHKVLWKWHTHGEWFKCPLTVLDELIHWVSSEIFVP
jgi:hypothetical protein